MMNRGFTLLELLLVVGIAAILIVAGIGTYGVTKRTMMVNETIKFTNLVVHQVRRVSPGPGNYGPAGVSFDEMLVNSDKIPEKYKYTSNGLVLGSPGCAGVCEGTDVWTTDGRRLLVAISLPRAYVAEFVDKFDPRRNADVLSITPCGESQITAATPNTVNSASIAAACGREQNTEDGDFSVVISFR